MSEDPHPPPAGEPRPEPRPEPAPAAAPAGPAAPARRAAVLHRLGALPWAGIGIATAVLVVLVLVVQPLRHAAAVVASKVIVFVASPLAPDVGDLDRLPESTKVVATDGSILADLRLEERRERIGLAALPEHVKQAVLAAEDENFYKHDGVDAEAILRAALRTAQGDTQGGSTISQQLAKINYTQRERTFLRKFKEVLYVTELEKRYSKDELLERYVNQVYFGEGAYGIATAARVYFNTTPDQLSPAQAAMLAGKISSPEGLDPRKDPEAVVKRRDQVLHNMAESGWLDQAALDQALATPLELAPEQPPEVAKAPHFVELVKREARGIEALGATPEERDRRLFTGGYVLETTLDPKAFDATTAAVQEQLGEPGDPTAAVVSVQPGDGAIRNLFSGLGFDRKFDVASQGRRQPGSAFKPFVYLAMLRAGIDPRSTFDAATPQEFEYNGEKFTVDNYEGKGGGQLNADDALVQSVNTVYMRIGLEVGPPQVVETARMVNAPKDEKAISAVASTSLGGLTLGVTPLEMAAAYATFAAKGVYAEPYAIARIRDAQGNVVYEHQAETRQAFEPDQVGVLNNATQRVVKEGTGRGASIGRPLAGKTGTTQNYGDAWFVGYVPQLATAVWVGHPERIEPMLNVHGKRVSGGSFPASIFAATMRAALDGVPPKPLPTASPDILKLRMLTPPTTAPPALPVAGLPPAGPPTTVFPDAPTSTITTGPGQGNRPTTTTTSTTAPPPQVTSSTTASTTTSSSTTTTTTSSAPSTTSTTGKKP